MLHRMFSRDTLRQFAKIFLFSCIVLGCIVLLLSFLSAGYEEETNLSPLAVTCYKLLKGLHFSLGFWNRLLPACSYFASIATTSFLVSLVILTLIRLHLFIGRRNPSGN
ncbi:MAG: hypothetical protein MJZ49_00145 [Bacteroidales bacterium]|nr:hypothetical protein [Bacteroidales bacterium]